MRSKKILSVLILCAVAGIIGCFGKSTKNDVVSPGKKAGAGLPLKNVIVYKEPGRFCGWPANYGMWHWGNEILVGFKLGYYQAKEDGHSYDREKPVVLAMARSTDGGQTWHFEDPKDLNAQKEPLPCPGGVNFAHPDFALRCRKNIFHISYDRGKTWEGPYQLPDFGGKELSARTDYIVNGKRDCMLFISAKEQRVEAGLQDRAFCVRTTDGGKTIKFVSWMTGEPIAIRSVMPSTVRISKNHLISALRRRLDRGGAEYRKNWIDVYESKDNGKTWSFLSKVADTDPGGLLHRNGNPPSMVRLTDGRLCVTYGYRGVPYGIRAKFSKDNGKTWGPEIHLRDDGRSWDMGYTRTMQRPDGKLVTVYYYTTEEIPEEHIAATIWDPDKFDY